MFVGLGPQEDGERVRETHRHTEVRAEAPPPTAGRFSGGTGSAGGTDQTYTHARLFVEHGGQRTDPLNFTTGVGVLGGGGRGGGGLGMRGARGTSRLTSSVDVGLILQ